MSQLEFVGTKVPSEWIPKLKRLTEETGKTQSAIVRDAIAAALGVNPVNPVNPLREELDGLKARVQALEELTQLSMVNQKQETEVNRVKPIAAVAEPKPVPPPPNGKPLADGGQWLSTSEAYERARKRGCKHDKKTSFSKFAKAHPDRLDVLGLRYLGANKPGDQRTASYEDLRFEG